MKTTSLFRSLILTSLLVSAVPGYSQGAQTQGAFAVTGVRVFDGTRVIPNATVVVEGGRITAVGPEVRPPAGAEVIDGSGKTLLPGFIDAHTHSFGDALSRALPFGVTTEMEMFGMPGIAQALREEQAKTGAPQRADLFSSGTLATAPGGHGTQYGIPIPTLSKPEEAEAFVAARFAEGSDYLKIVSEDGHGYGRDRPTLDTPTVKALIQAAHGKGKLAVVHVSTQERARAALESGANGLVHIFVDGPPEPGFGELAARTKAFVVPTLTVTESSVGGTGGQSVTADPRLAPYLRGDEVENLNRPMPARPNIPARLENAVAAVRALKAAGVPILAGSDAPNPGTSHGASLHREMEMLVAAGLSPAEALAAATSAPAKAFGLEDRGRIATGLRADLVLVQGDPSTDITATRDIVRIWKAGHPVERPNLGAPKAAEAAPAAPAPAAGPATLGLVSDFEGGAPTAAFGSGWADSTDQRMGGKSEVKTAVVPGGAQGGKAFEISGEVRTGSPYPWAGSIFFPGAQPMAPADLSKVKEISFQAQGDGGTYQLLLFAQKLGGMPVQAPFTAGPAWKAHTVRLADLGVDGSDITGIFWGASSPGAFRFRIDDVRLVAKD